MSDDGVTRFWIHLLTPDPGGPVHSGVGGTTMRIGTRSRHRIACRPELPMDGITHRGTTEPWAVRCDDCKATDEFKAIDRPKPGTAGQTGDMLADGRC
jgi:hypothetical protein